MAFFTILFAIMATCSYQCMAQDLLATMQQPKCSFDNLEEKRRFRFSVSYITLEKHGDDPTFNGTIKDKELNMCPSGTDVAEKGPAVNTATLIACKTSPQICKLDDGTFYHYDILSDCFRTYDSVKYPWGITRTNDTLGLYTSAGAKDIDMGTTFLIKELFGVVMPNATKPHNGCVRIDYFCTICQSECNRVSLYVGTRSRLEAFMPLGIWGGNVTILNQRCDIWKYD